LETSAKKESDDNRSLSEKRGKTAREQPPDRLTYSVGCVKRERCDSITLELDGSQAHKLCFLVDSGADITLVKNYKLLGTAEFLAKGQGTRKERRRIRN
jgi:hypothetical protein